VWFLCVGRHFQFFHWVNEKSKSPHLKSSVKLKCERVLLLFSHVITFPLRKRRKIKMKSRHSHSREFNRSTAQGLFSFPFSRFFDVEKWKKAVLTLESSVKLKMRTWVFKSTDVDLNRVVSFSLVCSNVLFDNAI
jgi:hypothetical protein